MAKQKTQEKKVESIRNPIVVVMGHVDHGKTTFLDSIRNTRVAEKEAGGITQNTRAHEVVLENGSKITFIDTPGHEAFAKMRERGSKVTDFVLLIVAADDGVQPQTKQSIEFAKKENVPIIVGINKIDIPGVNIQKIKKELSGFGVVAEEYGGDTLFFEISAKNKVGLDKLLEGIQLIAEISELKPHHIKPNSMGEAFVLESSLDKLVGNVALCILKAGNLNSRAFGVTPAGYFKVRAYLDHNQKNIDRVEESQPFWITGLRETLPAGETVYFAETEEDAKILHKLIEKEIVEKEEEKKADAETLFAQLLVKREEIKQGVEQKQLNVIVKASTEGTLEAILEKVGTIVSDEAKINILDSGTGNVTEDEILRAKLAKAIIVTFQLPTPNKVALISKQEKVLVRNYEVIYELFDELDEVLMSLESPIEEEIEIARAKIKQVFTLSDGTKVYGAEVVKGVMIKGYRIKFVRLGGKEEEELGKGKITSIRIKKEEVKEVKKGLDCGIMVDENLDNVLEGDEIVAYKIETI